MADPKHTPRGIKAPHGAKVTEIRWAEIRWADGHAGHYPNDILRGWCPCAECQGHGGTIDFVPGRNSDLRELEPVGNYALKLTWGDGHDTGLYTFDYLRSLCHCPECIRERAAADTE
jgi:DUF971 family protein